VTDPTTGPFKLANLGTTLGILDQDRTVAIAATLGRRPPLIRIGSTIKAPELDRERTGVSWSTSSELAPDVAALHLLINLGVVFDEIGDGRSRVAWRVRGRRANGEEWLFRRSNAYAALSEISFTSIVELSNHLSQIEINSFEDVTFKRIKVRAKIWTEFKAYHVESLTALRGGEPVLETGGPEIHPGDELVVEVTLRSEKDEVFTTALPLRVPDDVLGSAEISAFGGGTHFAASNAASACLFNHGECAVDGDDSFQELLDRLTDAPRNNDLIVALEEKDAADEDVATRASRGLPRVVDGLARATIDVVP
jgi:hypothetical protein